LPDLQEYGTTRGDAANINTPVYDIHGKIQEGSTVLADFTGDNSIKFPAVFSTLTLAQQDEIVAMVANRLIYMKAGM